MAPGATTGVTVAGGNGASAANQVGLPLSVALDEAGNLYVADFGNNRVQEFSPGAAAGVTVVGGNGAGSGANQLNGPEGVFVDGSGDVYVTDSGNDRVQEWAPGATTGVTVAGGNGQGGAANQFEVPTDVFVDSAGNVYVTDLGNSRVQEWGAEPNAVPVVTLNPQSQSVLANVGTVLFFAAANGLERHRGRHLGHVHDPECAPL
jgi:sugar lactone lactonase YvrE